MKTKTIFLIAACLCCSAALAPAQEQLPREATVKEIPGVITPGAKWLQVWQGTDNADGIAGTTDGSLLFAQEQPSVIRKLDGRGKDAVYVGWFKPDLWDAFESVEELPLLDIERQGIKIRKFRVYRCYNFRGMTRPTGRQQY